MLYLSFIIPVLVLSFLHYPCISFIFPSLSLHSFYLYFTIFAFVLSLLYHPCFCFISPSPTLQSFISPSSHHSFFSFIIPAFVFLFHYPCIRFSLSSSHHSFFSFTIPCVRLPPFHRSCFLRTYASLSWQFLQCCLFFWGCMGGSKGRAEVWAVSIYWIWTTCNTHINPAVPRELQTFWDWHLLMAPYNLRGLPWNSRLWCDAMRCDASRLMYVRAQRIVCGFDMPLPIRQHTTEDCITKRSWKNLRQRPSSEFPRLDRHDEGGKNCRLITVQFSRRFMCIISTGTNVSTSVLLRACSTQILLRYGCLNLCLDEKSACHINAGKNTGMYPCLKWNWISSGDVHTLLDRVSSLYGRSDSKLTRDHLVESTVKVCSLQCNSPHVKAGVENVLLQPSWLTLGQHITNCLLSSRSCRYCAPKDSLQIVLFVFFLVLKVIVQNFPADDQVNEQAKMDARGRNPCSFSLSVKFSSKSCVVRIMWPRGTCGSLLSLTPVWLQPLCLNNFCSETRDEC